MKTCLQKQVIEKQHGVFVMLNNCMCLHINIDFTWHRVTLSDTYYCKKQILGMLVSQIGLCVMC